MDKCYDCDFPLIDGFWLIDGPGSHPVEPICDECYQEKYFYLSDIAHWENPLPAQRGDN